MDKIYDFVKAKYEIKSSDPQHYNRIFKFMARINQEKRKEHQEIIMLQETVELLTNNTIIYEYFDLLKKILNERYTLTFKGHHDINTTIQDEQHLKNYFNNITGVKYF